MTVTDKTGKNAVYKLKAEAQIAETLDMLRNKSPLSALTERWFLIDEATERTEPGPQPVRYGQALGYILERASLPVSGNDLLLGRFIDKIPDEAEEARLQEVWKKESGRTPVNLHNGGHITLDYRGAVEHGIGGYIAQAEKKLAELENRGGDVRRSEFLRGMILVYKAHRRYIERYGEEADRQGSAELAGICRHIAQSAPETFHQAMQLILFINNIYYIYAGHYVATLSYGRIDDILYPLYKADIESGRLDRERAGYIIDDFNCKACITLGRGDHQLGDGRADGVNTGWQRNPLYDSPTYAVIGGYSNLGDHRENDLTLLFAERIIPRFENPLYIYRWTKDRPDGAWNTVTGKMRENSSLIVYNDETMIKAFKNAGIEDSHAADYSVHACNWPDIPEGYIVTDIAGGSIPNMIMDALLDNGRPRRGYKSSAELLAAVRDNFQKSIRERFAAYRANFRSGNFPAPEILTVADCFSKGTIEAAAGLGGGAAKYPAVYTLLRYIGTAADMITALEGTVFADGGVSLDSMADALACDFEGFDELWLKCIKSPKYGTDNGEADKNAENIMNMLLDVIDGEAVSGGIRDVVSLNVTITDMNHIHEGYRTGATPDGRRAGQPFSENLSPAAGGGASVTALLNSVSRLPFERIHSGAFNLRLTKSLAAGAGGQKRLAALLDTYFMRGGMQAQISVADTEELKRAQADPASYKDLMVRITGYSAVFVDMSSNGQNEIIRRDELN